MDNRILIQNSLDYIEDHLQTEITAAELAEQAHFSLFHYYRLFQQATGYPVMQYILRRRLLHGVYAIRKGVSKTDAAFSYGFDTYAGFYKAFCREFGASPSDYLQASRARRPYRIDITREDYMTVTHKKITQLLKNWGLEQETVTDLYDVGTGNSHENACGIGEAYILKYTANLPELEKTIAVAKALADVGLASAVPVRTLDGREYVQEDNAYFYLTRRLSGQQMVSARFGDGDGRFVGEIIGQLHLALKSIDTPVREADLIATVKNWALPKSKQVMGLSTEFCTEYMNNLESLYPLLPRQIIHRDPNPGNIIRCDDLWGFIDFDLAERNVRIYDPCYAATAVLSETFTGDNGDWLEIYRDIIYGYDSVAHLTEEERKAIPYVLLANQFVCVAWFSEQEQYAEIFETNRNMTRWLMDRMDALRDL